MPVQPISVRSRSFTTMVGFSGSHPESCLINAALLSGKTCRGWAALTTCLTTMRRLRELVRFEAGSYCGMPVAVSAQALKDVFEARLNPPETMPETFDAAQHRMNRLLASLIPNSTEDSSPERFFSSEWTEDDAAWLKDHIRKHSLDSASGEDAILYAEIIDIPNDVLVLLCNECVRKQDGPLIWFRTVIIGLLKKGKLVSMPDSYRIIALESCILKALTLLIHKRITDWANARGIIPDYQNGFREGYRTNNNPFILRCVKEWARAHGFSVYVAAVDATNAFPSTDHPTLWLKLLKMGMGGAIFDWLRMLYHRMEYYVRHGDSNSADFKAVIGLLTGDPASPVLWNLFMADLVMAPDPDDPVLSEVRIAIMAQADDVLLISFSAKGLQRKLNTLYAWCSKNFIVVNMVKTVILIFGPAPSPLPQFLLGSRVLSIMEYEKYVGVHIRTDTRNMFQAHYKEKASTARYCAHRIMGLEDSTGRLTPKEYKQLYMARVDCHLIHGCEVSPDSEDVHVKELSDIQVNFLRQILNVHSRSMLAPLYTETGIMPLRVRRYLVLLGYLRYLLGLPLPHLARACLNSSIELAVRGKKWWFGDLCTAASRLPFECPPPQIDNATPDSIKVYAKSVEDLALKWLQREVDSSDKLYLLHGRREPQKDKPPVAITLYLRHYLFMAKTQTHREALTSIMLSTHLLAVEILRYVDHEHPQVPRDARLCRFSVNAVETPEHALLDCIASAAVLDLRAVFLEKLLQTVPSLRQKMVELDSVSFLKAIIYQRSTIVLVAKYVHDVLEVFYSVPVYRP